MRKKALYFLVVVLSQGLLFSSDPLYPLPTLFVEEGVEKGFDLSVYKREPATKITPQMPPTVNYRFVPIVDSLYLKVTGKNQKLIPFQLQVDSAVVDGLIRVLPMVKYTFTFQPTRDGQTVVVMGGFNDWSRTSLPLADKNGDGILERTVYLKPQRHEYKFVVNGEEIIDPANPVFVSNNIGGWNSVLDLSEYRESPGGVLIKQSSREDTLRFAYQPLEDDSPLVRSYLFINNHLLPLKTYSWGSDRDLVISLESLPDGVLRLIGLDAKGRVIPENITLLKDGQPLQPGRQPRDWHFAVLYSILVDRFLDGNPEDTRKVIAPDLPDMANFHGGDLEGIIRKLEAGYFQKLGVSSLWLSPLQLQPEGAYQEWVPPHRTFTGYHGYWPIAPRTIDPRFGTREALLRLTELAHDQSIKVVLDFVSNHVHEEHPYFQTHREWFGTVEREDGSMNIRNWSEETRLTTWFDIFLPSYDYSNSPAAISAVVEDAIWWLDTYNLDGFRQDAVKHVPHEFWRTLTAKIRRRFPKRVFYQIGETFGSPDLIMSYVNPGELDAQFNFDIYFNARGPFSADRADFGPLEKVIQDNIVNYGPLNLMGNITSSHDQVRFIAFADHQLTFSDNGTERAFNNPPVTEPRPESYRKLVNFTAFNMAFPGVPVVYYGEEIGLLGAGDPDNRRPMRFEPELTPEEKWTLETVSQLIHLRRTLPALSVGDLVPLLSKGPDLIFAKVYFDETLLTLFHQDSTDTTITVSLTFPARRGVDLLSGDKFFLDRSELTVTMPAYSFRFLKME